MGRLIALVSGGKDSVLGALIAMAYGHDVVCIANMQPNATDTELGAGGDADSHCFQTVGYQAIDLFASCAALPLHRATIERDQSVATDLYYKEEGAGAATTTAADGLKDEVEVMYDLLKSIRDKYAADVSLGGPITGVCSGAILSNYQRLRVERVCQRLGLMSYGYLWQRSGAAVLDLVARLDVTAILIKVASMGLQPRRFLGRTLMEMRAALVELEEQFGGHPAGEGGEYESLVLDCPLFARSGRCMRIADGSTIWEERPGAGKFDAVPGALCFEVESAAREATSAGQLEDVVASYHAAANAGAFRFEGSEWAYLSNDTAQAAAAQAVAAATANSDGVSTMVDFRTPTSLSTATTTTAGGVTARQGLRASDGAAAPAAQVREILSSLLVNEQDPEATKRRILYTQVFASSLDDFASINAVYAEFFARTVPPPSRAYVIVPSSCFPTAAYPTQSGVVMDFYLLERGPTPADGATLSRDALHVQSISAWAAACIGPYAQANWVLSDMESNGPLWVATAGTLGLEPATMTLPGASIVGSSPEAALARLAMETRMCLWNLHHVLQQAKCRKGLQTPPSCTLGSGQKIDLVVYVAAPPLSGAPDAAVVRLVHAMWQDALRAIAGDEPSAPPLKFAPSWVRFVMVQQLPRNSLVEIAASVQNQCVETESPAPVATAFCRRQFDN
jgi:diphthine-ammonia ligase